MSFFKNKEEQLITRFVESQVNYFSVMMDVVVSRTPISEEYKRLIERLLYKSNFAGERFKESFSDQKEAENCIVPMVESISNLVYDLKYKLNNGTALVINYSTNDTQIGFMLYKDERGNICVQKYTNPNDMMGFVKEMANRINSSEDIKLSS